jgi:hypothetical protein
MCFENTFQDHLQNRAAYLRPCKEDRSKPSIGMTVYCRCRLPDRIHGAHSQGLASSELRLALTGVHVSEG